MGVEEREHDNLATELAERVRLAGGIVETEVGRSVILAEARSVQPRLRSAQMRYCGDEQCGQGSDAGDTEEEMPAAIRKCDMHR